MRQEVGGPALGRSLLDFQQSMDEIMDIKRMERCRKQTDVLDRPRNSRTQSDDQKTMTSVQC